MREKILCGLDVGSSKVSAVIAGYNPSQPKLKIMGVSEEECSGLKHGVVVNIENTNRAIARAIEKAEKEAEVKVKDVLLNINGNHIEGHKHQGATKVPHSDREITSEDVERVISSARAVPLSSDRQIVHAIPLDFKVDNQGGVEDPIGMEGNHLEVEVMLITGDTAPINNLDKCITRTGLGINRIIASVLAPAQSVVADEEKELGCLLVDFGAQTINTAMYIEGVLSFIGEIEIGSDFITYDLAHGLRTSFKEAKRIKESFGCASTKDAIDMEVEYIGVDGQSRRKIMVDEINKIIEPRVDDIIDLIAEQITRSGRQHLIPGGIILSGGGAEMTGIEEAIVRKLENYQVRLGRPRDLEGKVEKVNSPKYATSIGLLEYFIKAEGTHDTYTGQSGFFEKLKAWFEELF